MEYRQKRTPISEQLRKAMDNLGAEPLASSGFEDEIPEEGFSEEVASECNPQSSV
jgi:hypothetical protein